MPTNLPLDHANLRTGESNHPVGTAIGAGTGAAAGAAAGAAIGSAAGPLGAAIGAAAGAIAAGFGGAVAGRRMAESVMPSTEDHYWSHHYAQRPYVKPGATYNDYKPAYSFGARMRQEYCKNNWSDVESQVQTAWEQTPEAAQLPWPQAAPAIRDAWDKLSPCDPDL